MTDYANFPLHYTDSWKQHVFTFRLRRRRSNIPSPRCRSSQEQQCPDRLGLGTGGFVIEVRDPHGPAYPSTKIVVYRGTVAQEGVGQRDRDRPRGWWLLETAEGHISKEVRSIVEEERSKRRRGVTVRSAYRVSPNNSNSRGREGCGRRGRQPGREIRSFICATVSTRETTRL